MVLLHQELKEKTRDIHLKLHEHVLLKPIETNSITLQYYKAILSAFYCYYSCYEPLNFHNTAIPNAPTLQWIKQDVYFEQCNHTVITTLPPVIVSKEDMIAYLYVKQGSTLGGQVISKQLYRQLGLVGGKDQFFFYGYYKETSLKWKSFIDYLHMLDDKVNHDHITQKAYILFSFLEHTLTCAYKQMR